MRGDFTRDTFRPERRYTGVRMQQGRVQLDADWNEQIDIETARERASLSDLLGASSAPRLERGFGVVTDPATQLPAAEVTRLQGISGLLPLTQGDFLLTRGRLYVDGVLCDNSETFLNSSQAARDLPGAVKLTAKGRYLVYLDVWERDVTVLDDTTLLEPALRGVDTTTRTRLVTQVKVVPVTETNPNCLSTLAVWDALFPAQRGRLSAKAEPPSGGDDPCTVPQDAAYTGLENQLYRVEIHDSGNFGGTGQKATYKWSRDNGSIAAAWTGKSGGVLTIDPPPRDEALGFAPGNWVELTDDTHELTGAPGTLVPLKAAAGNTLTIDPALATGTVDIALFPRNPKVRKWDSAGKAEVKRPQADGGYLQLEHGVRVRFEDGRYDTGDYWLIPARPEAGGIEWDEQPVGTPVARGRAGTRHRFCRLVLIEFDPAGTAPQFPSPSKIRLIGDCRRSFPALSELTAFFYRGGDGQEAIPGQVLRQPLRVGVANGEWPIRGAQVEFKIDSGKGMLADAANAANSGVTVKVETGADGTAAVNWTLGDPGWTTLPNRDQASDTVTARLLDAAGATIHVPVHFIATLSIASSIGYMNTQAGGIVTVKAALDSLQQPELDKYLLRAGDTMPGPLTIANWLGVGGDLTVGKGGNASLKTRHINGKHWQNDGDEALFLQYDTGFSVEIGRDAKLSALNTYGDIQIIKRPANDTTAALTRLSLITRRAGGADTTWSLYAAAVGGGFGVEPGAFEIWQYPETVPRFKIRPTGEVYVPGRVNASDLVVRGARTFLLGGDPNYHWIMAGGTTEGVHNALAFKPFERIIECGWTLTGDHKQFRIDHPLDPENKHLVHACLEGPEVGVYYRGETRLVDGRAEIELPDYFEALTRGEGRTVTLTPKFAGAEPISMLAASEVRDARVAVRAIDENNPIQGFFWEVKAVRADLDVLDTEPPKVEAPVAEEPKDSDDEQEDT